MMIKTELQKKAIDWWDSMTFEEKFYKVIEFLGTDEHPDRLQIEEIEDLYNQYA